MNDDELLLEDEVFEPEAVTEFFLDFYDAAEAVVGETGVGR